MRGGLWVGGEDQVRASDSHRDLGAGRQRAPAAALRTGALGSGRAGRHAGPSTSRRASRRRAPGDLARVEEPETGSTPKAALALRALVYADDAELAYGALAELLKAQPKRRGEVLAVVYPLALRPRRRGEALDPPGLAALIAQLKVLSRDATAPASVRDRAVSAWNAFSRAGYTAPP